MAANTPMTTGSSRGQGMPLMVEKLLAAATSGDSTSMLELVSQDRNILLGTTLQGNNCLHIASIYGHEGFCKDVMGREECLIATVNVEGETPLVVAVRYGQTSLASFLLESYCQPAFKQAILQQDMSGFNALHHAVRNGQKDLSLELITAEPALSQAVTRLNESPMFLAVMMGLTDICEKLIQTPYCAYSGGLHRRNCLHAAVVNGNPEIVKVIMQKCPELAREDDFIACTPVRQAVLDGKSEILRVMLEHDPTLGYEINSKGSPLLCSAASQGCVAAAQEILKHCPDAPSYDNTDGQTLLHIAVYYDQEEFFEFVMKTPLLRKVVNMQDIMGKTALHIAVKKCNPRLVIGLLFHQDVNTAILDSTGNPAAWELSNLMHHAKTSKWNELVMLLSKENPQGASSLHNLLEQAKQHTTSNSGRDANSLNQSYTTNTSVVAILITTITFTAAFTLPGGYNSAAGSEGLPVMFQKAAFKAFLISDTLAMCSSFGVAFFICIIARWEDYEFLLYYRSFTRKVMWFAFMATTTAFTTGLYTVLAPRLPWLAIQICAMVTLSPFLTWLLGNWPVLKLRYRLGKTFNPDLLDMA